MTFIKKDPIKLKIDDYRAIRSVLQDQEELSPVERNALMKVEQIIHNIERAFQFNQTQKDKS